MGIILERDVTRLSLFLPLIRPSQPDITTPSKLTENNYANSGILHLATNIQPDALPFIFRAGFFDPSG